MINKYAIRKHYENNRAATKAGTVYASDEKEALEKAREAFPEAHELSVSLLRKDIKPATPQ